MGACHFIAIGANLASEPGGTPLQNCEAAVARLAGHVRIGRACRSRWFSSAPIPASTQPRYINGMLRVETELTPTALLFACQAIEQEAGRVRGLADAARTLDLDLIDMAGLIRVTGGDPVLPHPRAGQRAFVLLPLRDVAPDWVHPVTGQSIGALISALPHQDIHPV
jgi:2-amino-4-hydroxy-6-hydroxymethyldihydropteridine diphosphokinase